MTLWETITERRPPPLSPAREAPVVETAFDNRLAERVVGAMRRCWLVPADRVTVAVSGGWVTVGGEVPHLYQWMAATHAVRQVDGVRGIHDTIAVPGLEARLKGFDGSVSGLLPSSRCDLHVS